MALERQKHQDNCSTVDKPWRRGSTNSGVATDLERKTSEVCLKVSNFKELVILIRDVKFQRVRDPELLIFAQGLLDTVCTLGGQMVSALVTRWPWKTGQWYCREQELDRTV